MLKIITAFLTGLVFGIGILISGMANPAKVLNFFDLFGTWDPSLMFVMGGALVVTAIGYRLVFRMGKPLLGAGFQLPTRQDLDVRLIGGSAIFGIGWGLAGFCPGGLVPALGTGLDKAFMTAIAILAGMIAVKAVQAALSKRPAAKSA